MCAHATFKRIYADVCGLSSLSRKETRHRTRVSAQEQIPHNGRIATIRIQFRYAPSFRSAEPLSTSVCVMLGCLVPCRVCLFNKTTIFIGFILCAYNARGVRRDRTRLCHKYAKEQGFWFWFAVANILGDSVCSYSIFWWCLLCMQITEYRLINTWFNSFGSLQLRKIPLQCAKH